MQRVQNTGRLGLTVSKYLDTNLIFQTNIFLISVVINNKRSSGSNGKTSDCFSKIRSFYHKLST